MTGEESGGVPQSRLLHAFLFTQVYQLRAMQEKTVPRCTSYLWATLPFYFISVIVIFILNRPPRKVVQRLMLDELPEVPPDV